MIQVKTDMVDDNTYWIMQLNPLVRLRFDEFTVDVELGCVFPMRTPFHSR